jgi:transposase
MPCELDRRREESEILKLDKLGRVLTSAKRREALVAGFRSSGMSGMQYAKYIGVKYSTFSNWKQKEGGGKASKILDSGKKKGERLKWIEAILEEKEEKKPSSPLLIQLAGGERIEISNSGQIELAAELLKRLAGGRRLGC